MPEQHNFRNIQLRAVLSALRSASRSVDFSPLGLSALGPQRVAWRSALRPTMDALNAKAFYTMLVAGLDNAKGPRVHPPGAAIGKRDSHISNATVDHAEGSMPDHDTALPGYQEMCGPFLGILRVYGGPECAAYMRDI